MTVAGWYKNTAGYRVGTLTKSNHMKYEHIAIVEKALGGPIPKGSEVHHVNEDTSDNSPGNLVLCQDRSYHKLLHCRRRALQACGHADWRPCAFCKKYDDPKSMAHFNKPKGNELQRYCHKQCRTEYAHRRKKRLATCQCDSYLPDPTWGCPIHGHSGMR